MKRVQLLWEHPLYQEQFQKLQKSEEQRIFCNHTLSHFLDVARLTYIYSLESGAGLDKELIYAAALLHDIGRWKQISEGIPHDAAGAALAGELLPECGFDESETAAIQNAILHHRTRQADPLNQAPAETPLALFLRKADKRCRCCFACPASPQCNWSQEQKNRQIIL